jgi:hypothetical protein
MGGADCDGYKIKSTEVLDVARGMWRYAKIPIPLRGVGGWTSNQIIKQ